MMKTFCRAMGVGLGLATLALAEDGTDLAQRITQAKPGTTVPVPAGTFAVGEVHVPAGVTVRGAGFAQTLLAGSLVITRADTVTVAALTVQDAPGAAFTVENSRAVTLAGVRAQNSGVGILLDHAEGARVENSIVTGNRAGVALRHATASAVVNCTVLSNTDLALSLVANRRCAVFNNLLVNSQTGVFCAPDNVDLALDYNLYVALFVGSTTGEPTRESLPSWRSRFGYDRHSVELKAEFGNAAAGDYRPVTPLPWSPGRTTASDWGITELAGIQAPDHDLAGAPRKGRPDLGAYEAVPGAAPQSDGRFTVAAGAGVTSAGLFTPDGRNVAWLFQNLPLARGDYEFALPPGIKPGAYELRVAESDIGLRYVLPVGSIGADNRLENSSSIDPTLVVFDPLDNLVQFQGGNEDHTQARSFEQGLQKARWRLPGNGGAAGAAFASTNELFFIRNDGMLYKVSAATGEGMPIDGASFRKQFKDVFSPKITGMAELDGKLYVADPDKNKLFVTGTAELTFARSIDLPAPTWPSADRRNNLLWVISGEKLVALDSAGTTKHEAAPVAKPVALSVNAGRMAVYSAATRRVHVFDCTDPGKLKPLTVMGREWKPGDTGLGRLQPDRLSGQGCIALAAGGDVVVLDGDAPKLFKADGTFVRGPMPMWGQFVGCGWWTGPDGKPELQVAGLNQRQTMVLDLEKESWMPGTRYSLPTTNSTTVAAFFTEAGRNFVAFSEEVASPKRWLVRIDPDGVGKPVLLLAPVKDKPEFTAQTDANGDGIIDDNDPAAIVNGPDGKPVAHLQFISDGSLLAGGRIIPRRADGKGELSYDWSQYDPSHPAALPTGGQGNFNGGLLADGSWLAAGGKGRGFGGGYTVVSALGADGKPRWEHPLDYHSTVASFKSARILPGIILGLAVEEFDTFFLTHDGLGLGILGPDPAFRWTGYWHDQDWSLRSFVSPAGRHYVLLGDYVRHTAHCLEITGHDTVKRGTVKITVSEARAAELASATSEPVHMPVPAKVTVHFSKLAAPLTIDGDLKKWRTAGVKPAIVVTPPGIAPGDCSAVIRCAWEGDDLYFQVIKFDDVVTFHQNSTLHYKQDSTELALNGGFMGGYKFSVTRTTDKGEIVLAETFLIESEFLDAQKVPRVIRVLDNAKEVDERRIIEQAYGVDLSNCKVIVSEFKLPVHHVWGNEAWPKGKKSSTRALEMTSGTGFWFGWFIDDNDVPGSDEQHAYSWPVTFQAFGNADQGAWGVLE